MRFGATLACLVVLTGCGAGPSNLGPPASSGAPSATPDVSAITNFVEPTATSGCPSPECSDILGMVTAGAKTDAIPTDLDADCGRLVERPEIPRRPSQCSQLPLPDLKQNWQPCIYPTGAKPDAPLIVVIGDSQAWMWSTAVQKMARQLGYRAAGVQHAGCHMPEITLPTTAEGITDEQCRAWKTAAINWVNTLNPAVVLVSSAVSRAAQKTRRVRQSVCADHPEAGGAGPQGVRDGGENFHPPALIRIRRGVWPATSWKRSRMRDSDHDSSAHE